MSSASAEPIIEDSLALAMTLYEAAFISGWSAAEHWDLTEEEVFDSISVVTSRPPRGSEQVAAGVRFTVRTLPAKRCFGDRRVWSGSKSIQMADPSRMHIDILDAPRFGGGGRHTLDVARAYWQSSHRNPDKLLAYAVRFERGAVFKRLGFIAETFGGEVSNQWLEACRKGISKGIADLDPDVPPKGPVSGRWRLRLNIPVEAPCSPRRRSNAVSWVDLVFVHHAAQEAPIRRVWAS